MPKFFVKENQVKQNSIKITGEDVNHIKNVLRKRKEDTLEICNQDTSENYLAKIVELEDSSIECEIIKRLQSLAESNLHIHIFQGLPKSDKMELIIQKSVELGANEITPVAMKRSVVKIAPKDETKKIARWQKISEVASKQCGRDIVPKINNITNIQNICNLCQDYDIVLVAYELEEKNTLKTELKKLKDTIAQELKIKIAVVIGPEGGLEKNDVEKLKNNGAKIVTLGKRILRTETVALNVISVITYELES